jgi:inhibitor of Bruton tyrosine kinase
MATTEGAQQGKDAPAKAPVVRPQRVSALKRQWGAVRDVALGADGSIILCTSSGHIYVRARSFKGAAVSGLGIGQTMAGSSKSFRFQRVPYVQRAIAVRANETGAMAALRTEYRPAPISIIGNGLTEDMAKIRPYVDFERVFADVENRRVEPGQPASIQPYESARIISKNQWVDDAETGMDPKMLGDAEDAHDANETSVSEDIFELARLCDLLSQDKLSRKRFDGSGLFERSGSRELVHGADLMIRMQSAVEAPVHKLILAARSQILLGVLGSRRGLYDRESGISIKFTASPGVSGAIMRRPTGLPRLAFTGCHPLAVLILIHYLYTDQFLAIGDIRITHVLAPLISSFKVQTSQVVKEVAHLARILELKNLVWATQWIAKRPSTPCLQADMKALFDRIQNESIVKASNSMLSISPMRPDIVLKLSDKDIYTHSVVLRARSPFFEIMLNDEMWTRDKWSEDGMLTVSLQHLKYKYTSFALRFICFGEEGEMFEHLGACVYLVCQY